MKEIIQLISNIDNNVRKITGQLEQIRKENGVLKEESLRLHAENDELRQRLINSEILLTARQITEGIDNQTGSESARKKLNELIREIDKCILMLED